MWMWAIYVSLKLVMRSLLMEFCFNVTVSSIIRNVFVFNFVFLLNKQMSEREESQFNVLLCSCVCVFVCLCVWDRIIHWWVDSNWWIKTKTERTQRRRFCLCGFYCMLSQSHRQHKIHPIDHFESVKWMWTPWHCVVQVTGGIGRMLVTCVGMNTQFGEALKGLFFVFLVQTYCYSICFILFVVLLFLFDECIHIHTLSLFLTLWQRLSLLLITTKHHFKSDWKNSQ